MKARFFFVFLLILFTSTECYAFDGISLGVGRARGSIDIYHVGFQKQFGSNWFKSRAGYLSGYHEISLNYCEHGRESIKQAAYSPVFTYVFAGLTNIMSSYVEAGIGISYLSDKTIAGRDLSTHFQFEDRIGVGIKIGQRHTHDLNIRYVHYSNASIKQPNDGIDMVMISYTYSLQIQIIYRLMAVDAYSPVPRKRIGTLKTDGLEQIQHKPTTPIAEPKIDNILAALLKHDVELRIMPSLWKLRQAVMNSTLGYSIICLDKAQPLP